MHPTLVELEAGGAASSLRLLHVTPTYYPAARYGGPIVSVHGLCRALAARGHDVHVFTTNVDGDSVSNAPLDAVVDLDGVKVRYFATGFGRRVYRAPDMADALSREIQSFDVAHLHSVFLWPTTTCARLARRRDTPYVLSPRGMLAPELIDAKSRLVKRGWIAAFERANIAGAASLHVTAELEAVHLARMNLQPRRIDVVPNGVDAPDFEDAPAPERRAPRVLYLGRLSWKKQLDCLIRAMVHVPGAELIIAGFDDEGIRQPLEALASGLDLGNRVRFLAPVVGKQKWRLLRDCDVFALPSRHENFGVAALEALACARPVIAAPGVGLAEAIVAAGAGLCVESEPRRLGTALAQLLADGALRARMGKAGRELALAKYSWSGVAAQMEQVYLRAIDTQKAALGPRVSGPRLRAGGPPSQERATDRKVNATASITPVILTYNEEANLSRTLDGVAWARDIVIVDSFSQDATLAIASRYPNVRVYQRRFDTHAEQWNFAIEKTNIASDWILALDADYVAPPEMRVELHRAAEDSRRVGYLADFRYCVFGRPLRASLYPSHVVLFRKGFGHYAQCGHTQRLILSGEIGHLAVKFDHDDRKPLNRWIEAQTKYARLEADYLASGRPDLRAVDRLRKTAWLAPIAVLLHVLLAKRCLMEGWPGWFYALQRALFEILFCLVWLDRRQRQASAGPERSSLAPNSLLPSLDRSAPR